MNRLAVILPLAIFILLVIVLAVGLTLKPREVNSPFIGKPAPDFSLPRLHKPNEQISLVDLKGKVVLVNVWGSWCPACRDEHGLLVEIANSDLVPIYGLNWKDTREKALYWLQQLGDPYTAVAFDQDGRVGIDWGVYGAPETFVLSKDGIVAHKHIGPITTEVWRDTLWPLIQKLRQS